MEWTPVMPQKDLQNSMAAAHLKQDGSRNDRSGEDQRWSEKKVVELDRPSAKEGTNRRLRCGPRVDSG